LRANVRVKPPDTKPVETTTVPPELELAPFRWSLHLCVRGGFPDAPSSRCLSGGLS
jgi:hypothetical protein